MVYDKVVNGLIFLQNKRRSLADNIKLEAGRTYIIPTGFGFAFGGVSFVLLFLAIGYANNLLYFFVFLLISMALTGTWLTNKNIEQLQVVDMQYSLLFAQEKNFINITVQNSNLKSPLFDVEFYFQVKNDQNNKSHDSNLQIISQVIDTQIFTVPWTPSQRGASNFPRLTIQSRFPYKMLRAWKYFEKQNPIIIYPCRKGISRIPTFEGNQSDQDAQSKNEIQGLFRDFRDYQNTDSPSRIDWRRSLKHQKHLVKNFEIAGENKILLDWSMTEFIDDFEERVSQLSLWIDLCHKKMTCTV